LEVKITGVICAPLLKYPDQRGWLAENFPVMAYVSVTNPGVGRGPHAHRYQTDLFCFYGPGDFRVILWDNRPDSFTFGIRQDFILGESNPAVLIVPPGVVHGYKNVSDRPGFVCNFANRLYRGIGRVEAVDEIRFEDDLSSPFKLE
jgi:dTDP-4-dehydrorhamnose 3,5-epimerase